MLNGVTFGQYLPGNSPLHRMDPRAKILMTIMMIVVVFSASSVVGYALLFAFVAGLIAMSGVKPLVILRTLRPIIFIILITFVLNLFFNSSGNEIFRLGFISITDVGLRNALYMAMRLVLLVVSTQLLTLTTSPIALTDGIERLLKPLSKIGFPSHELAMMMSIALRFIPTLLEEADKIRKAQMARGADFESGNLIKRAKAMIPLLVPLFVSAFRRADDLALAMEARCYRGGDKRTRMKILKFARVDGIAALIMSALCAAIFIL